MMMMRARIFASFLSFGLAAGCAAEGAEQHDRSVAEPGTLRLGDYGPEVSAVHDYLLAYGYLPNRELGERFPGWRPVVSTSPAQPDLFDETIETAVRSLQTMAGLEPTGMVDAALQDVMAQPRCGVPDRPSTDAELVEKFALWNLKWPTSGKCAPRSNNGQYEITYDIPLVGGAVWAAHGVSFSYDTFESVVEAAMRTWESASAYKFVRDFSSPCVTIDVGSISGGTVLAEVAPNAPNGVVSSLKLTVDADQNWVAGLWLPPAGTYGLEAVVLHELGHVLLLDHSGPGIGDEPIMTPFYDDLQPGQRWLELHDFIAANLRNPGRFDLHSPAATQVISTSDGLWALGNTTVGNGFEIWHARYPNDNWTKISGQLTELTVTNTGVVWGINKVGSIYKRTGTAADGSWTRVAGPTMSHIAASRQIWALGLEVTRGTRDHYIYQYNASSDAWTRVTGYAADIAVGDNVYVLNEAGNVYARNVPSGTWDPLESTNDPALRKLSGGADGFIWGIDSSNVAYIWNWQSAVNAVGGIRGTPARKQWLRFDSSVRSIHSSGGTILWVDTAGVSRITR